MTKYSVFAPPSSRAAREVRYKLIRRPSRSLASRGASNVFLVRRSAANSCKRACCCSGPLAEASKSCDATRGKPASRRKRSPSDNISSSCPGSRVTISTKRFAARKFNRLLRRERSSSLRCQSSRRPTGVAGGSCFVVGLTASSSKISSGTSNVSARSALLTVCMVGWPLFAASPLAMASGVMCCARARQRSNAHRKSALASSRKLCSPRWQAS